MSNRVVIIGYSGMGKSAVTQELIKKFHENQIETIEVVSSVSALENIPKIPIAMVDDLPPYICEDFRKESISKEGKWPRYSGYKNKGRK